MKRHWGHGHSILCGVVFDRSGRFDSTPVEAARPAITRCKKCGMGVACADVIYFDCCTGEVCKECLPTGVPGVVQPCMLCDNVIWLANPAARLRRGAERGEKCARRLLTYQCLEKLESHGDLGMTWLWDNKGEEAYALAILYSDESCGRLDFAKAADSYANAHKLGDYRVAPEF